MARESVSRIALLTMLGLLAPRWASGQATDQAARDVRVLASLAPGLHADKVEAELVVTTGSGGTRMIPIQVPGEVRARVPEPHCTVELKAPGYWSRGATLDPAEIRLRLHPLAKIEGSVSMAGRAGPPERLRLFLDGETLLAQVTLLCPVDRKGHYSCDGPAGRFDVQVRANGFAPHFLWDVDLASGRRSTLEPLALEPGASVTGFALRPDGTPPGPKATVHLAPQVFRESGSHDRAEGKPLSVLERDAKPEEHGFFVFADVAPGTYDVVASEPGWTSGRAEGIEVVEGRETYLAHPVEISAPVGLQVQISPPVAPSGQPWRLRVLGQHRLVGADGLMTQCDETGYAEFSAVPEDTYLLVAVDPVAGQPFDQREVEVSAPLAFVDWQLPLVIIEGTVQLGKKPLAAQVTFGPTQMSSASFESDEDGEFGGMLSKAGEWEVMVENRDLGVSRWLRGVEVPEPSKPDEPVEVELKLPSTELRALVVDEEYRPIQAQVIVQPMAERDRSSSSWSQPNGIWEARGLPPGPVELFAETKDHRVSPVTRVDLPPDTAVGPIQLRVEAQRAVQGSIQGPEGPVPGARILLRGAGSPLYSSVAVAVTSDARGLFSFEVPAGVQEAHLEVRAAGRPLTVRRVTLGDSLPLRLEPVWGTAQVDWDQGLVDRLWMVKDGASFRFNQFVSWAMSQPGEGEALAGHTRIPRLEPGVWHLCAPQAGSAEWLQMVALGIPGESCTRLEVTAWGEASAKLAVHGANGKE